MRVQFVTGRIVEVPRAFISTYDSTRRCRCLRLTILRKPKLPIDEGQSVPTWIDLRTPPFWLGYWRVCVDNLDSKTHHCYDWPCAIVLDGKWHKVVPIRVLKGLSVLIEAIRTVSGIRHLRV